MKARVAAEVDAEQRPSDDEVQVTYWRAGEIRTTMMAPGPFGLYLDRGGPDRAIRALAERTRGMDERVAEASLLDQVRLFGGSDLLRPLPGTRWEAEWITEVAAAAGSEVTMLLGEEATIGNLESAVEGARYVHLATHGLVGSIDRPYDASLALTRPEVPTVDDIGFLTLDRLIRSWQGRLAGCDLVTLSACETQRGVRRGASLVALPWGFFYAGASTVVASFWKVDDTATALLMGRLYQNLFGVHDEPRTVRGRAYAPDESMTNIDALDESKRWLRGLTIADLRKALDIADDAEWARFQSELRGLDVSRPVRPDTESVLAKERPFEHPYYWAAFVLIGSPE
jgi:CHAT domain-containing protein